jgi:hypothetical protein
MQNTLGCKDSLKWASENTGRFYSQESRGFPNFDLKEKGGRILLPYITAFIYWAYAANLCPTTTVYGAKIATAISMSN